MRIHDAIARALLAVGTLLAISGVAFQTPALGLVGVVLLAAAFAIMLGYAGPHGRTGPRRR